MYRDDDDTQRCRLHCKTDRESRSSSILSEIKDWGRDAGIPRTKDRRLDRVLLSPRNFSPAKSRSEITVENPQIQSRIEEENKDWNIINTELHYSFYRSKVFSLRLISKIFRHHGDLDSHNPLARYRVRDISSGGWLVNIPVNGKRGEESSFPKSEMQRNGNTLPAPPPLRKGNTESSFVVGFGVSIESILAPS